MEQTYCKNLFLEDAPTTAFYCMPIGCCFASLTSRDRRSDYSLFGFMKNCKSYSNRFMSVSRTDGTFDNPTPFLLVDEEVKG
jgi:hypothetical protein